MKAGIQTRLLLITTDRQRRGVIVTLKDVWQKFPKELEIGNEGITVHFWPKHGGDTFDDSEELARDQIHKLLWAHEGRYLDLQIPATGINAIADLKTTQSAAKWDFSKSIYDFGYYEQGPVYLNAAAKHGRIYEHFLLICIEKKPPYAVAVYRMKDDLLEPGLLDFQRRAKTFAECLKTGVWPAYSQEIQEISIPAYGRERLPDVS